jgi:hypothetical protein
MCAAQDDIHPNSTLDVAPSFPNLKGPKEIDAHVMKGRVGIIGPAGQQISHQLP